MMCDGLAHGDVSPLESESLNPMLTHLSVPVPISMITSC